MWIEAVTELEWFEHALDRVQRGEHLEPTDLTLIVPATYIPLGWVTAREGVEDYTELLIRAEQAVAKFCALMSVTQKHTAEQESLGSGYVHKWTFIYRWK